MPRVRLRLATFETRLAPMGWLALTLALAGCVLVPPPPATGAETGGCHPGAYGPRSALRCTRDADCLLCGAPRGCGELRTRRQVALSNEACPPPRPERCQGRAPSCCGGRCVLSLGPPPL